MRIFAQDSGALLLFFWMANLSPGLFFCFPFLCRRGHTAVCAQFLPQEAARFCGHVSMFCRRIGPSVKIDAYQREVAQPTILSLKFSYHCLTGVCLCTNLLFLLGTSYAELHFKRFPECLQWRHSAIKTLPCFCGIYFKVSMYARSG